MIAQGLRDARAIHPAAPLALRSTLCVWYKDAMGTLGSCNRTGARKRVARQTRRFSYIMFPPVSGLLLACCSSVATLSPGPNQPVAVAPPPNYATAAAAQPPSATLATNEAAAAGYPYPRQSVVDYFKEDSQAASVAPAGTPVSGADQSGATGNYPYPKQSLTDYFKGSTSPQIANVPHPPSTYTASGQPYTPPPSQPAYGVPAGAVPPAAAQPAAAPQPSNNSNASTGAYPSQSLFDLFSNKSSTQ